MPNSQRKKNLHDTVARHIGALILNGTYAPGALLPNEAEWTKQFGASRTAVREAIKMLIAKGLVHSRPKIGSRVLPRLQWNMLDRDVLDWHHAASDWHSFLESTQEARRIIEPGIAELAARRRSPEQLARLHEALHKMQTSQQQSEIIAADIAFHEALILAANNDLVTPFGLIIEKALRHLFDFTTARNPRYPDALRLHADIVAAIESQDVAGAAQAMRALISDTDRVIAAARADQQAGQAQSP